MTINSDKRRRGNIGQRSIGYGSTGRARAARAQENTAGNNRRPSVGRLALTACLMAGIWGCRAIKQADAGEPGRGGQTGQTDGVQAVTLKTGDGWTIAADWYGAGKTSEAVILLHQRGGQASDWVPLCRALQKAGIGALALDQRGAGRSIQGPGGTGEDAPWLTSNDTAAAIAWLHSHNGAAQSAVGIAGASYGANNALIYASAHPDQIRGVALYSPGANYNGLDAVKPARTFKGLVNIYHDKNDAIAGSGPRQINAALAGEHALHLTNGSEHGTALLTPVNIKETVAFFQKALRLK